MVEQYFAFHEFNDVKNKQSISDEKTQIHNPTLPSKHLQV